MLQKSVLFTVILSMLIVSGCTTETSSSIETMPDYSHADYQGVTIPVIVEKFDNLSSFQRGIFSDNVDRLGNQAKISLISQLRQTNYFNVLNKTGLNDIRSLTLQATNYVVIGKIIELSRQEVSSYDLFGILGRTKKQIAYAKITLDIIDINSEQVVCSSQGIGEYQLTNKEVLGFGSTVSYDSSLNSKVLDISIKSALKQLITHIQQQQCHLTPINVAKG